MRSTLGGVYFDRWIRSTLNSYFDGVNPELLVVGESVRLSLPSHEVEFERGTYPSIEVNSFQRGTHREASPTAVQVYMHTPFKSTRF